MAEDLTQLSKQVAQALRDSEEFQNLQTAFQTMKSQDTTFELFKRFQRMQTELQSKQMSGQQVTEAEMKEAHDLADKVGKLDTVVALMKSERALNALLSQLNQTITAPISDLYKG